MLTASLLPVVGNLAFLAGVRPPWDDDPTPVLLFLGALTAFYATIHFRVIDLNPLVEREALLALPDGIIVLDNECTVVELNSEAARLLVVPGRPSVGKPLAALLAGSALGMELRPVLGGLSKPHTHHVHYESADGLCTIEVRSRPLLAANGAVSGALLLLRDVSERVRAEQAQARHLAELSMINRVARAANTAADAEGLVRAAAETIATSGLWERVGVGLLGPDGSHLSVVADVAADGVGQSFEGLLIGGGAGEALVAVLRAGRGQIFDLDDPETRASPLGEGIADEGLCRLIVIPLYHQGEPLGLLALGSLEASLVSQPLLGVAETIGELITDAVVRARLYDESRQAERLKASILANVSHELRTPLTSIIGYVEMLQRGIYGPLPERMIEPLGYMRLSSGTLLRLISDILDFSRAEAGHLRVELSPVDMLHAVANVVGQLRPLLADRGLDLELEVPPGLPRVWGNQARLEQVVSNLVGNAVKFTDHGRIGIRACRNGGRLRLSVTDTGVGIAPEHLGMIFQEFRRLETPGRRVGGTGLGLAITRRLVELMGGAISVESSVGEGSTFIVDLDVAEEIVDDQGAALWPAVRHVGD
ncbi:MAG: PAS domain-containing protein [Chloroflexales bacterium]|nr:PAS domain-containing protein [Chloroflexales bacterium]